MKNKDSIYIYEQINSDLNYSLSSLEKNKNNSFENLNENSDRSRILNEGISNINLSKYFEKMNNNLSIKGSEYSNNNFEDNIFQNNFSTPKKQEKLIEYIPDVFNDSHTENKNLMVSNLDIKLLSSNKQNRKINIAKEENDLKKIIEKNVKDYFKKKLFENPKYLNFKKNNYQKSKNNTKSKRKIIQMKDSKIFQLFSSNKTIKFKNIYDSVPKKEKKISFYNMYINNKSSCNSKDKQLNSQKIKSSNNSTNYSSSGKSKVHTNNNSNNHINIQPKISQFKIKDKSKNKNKNNNTLSKTTNKQVSTISFYNKNNLFQNLTNRTPINKINLNGKKNHLKITLKNKLTIPKKKSDLFLFIKHNL